MKKLLLLGALLAVGSFSLQDVTIGHGGTYRGPGDTVPPGGGPASGTPTGSGPPGPGPGPVGQTGTTVTGGPAVDSTDLTTWQFWWGFNKEPYLMLRDAIHSKRVRTGDDDWFIGRGEKKYSHSSLRPSDETIRKEIVPVLLEALENETQNDIVTGCLIALAKIGDAKDERGQSAFQEVIKDFLSDGNQEIAETAAIALGILANDSSVELLQALMMDQRKGHEAVGSTSVPYRTRAFAAYGLGLIGHRTEDNSKRQAIAQSLIEVLQLPRQATRDLKVAALTSLGLVPIDAGLAYFPPAEDGRVAVLDAAHHASTRQTQVRYLLDYFKDPNEHYLLRAHAPRALAKLMTEAAPDLRLEFVEALVEAAAPRTKERSEVIQSAVLAMGQLGDCDADGHDETIRETLRARIKATGKPQAKRFAVISLAQVGGRPGTNEPDKGYADIKSDLTKYLARSGLGMSQLKPWIGLALGVMQRTRTKNTGVPDRDVALALRTALIDCKRPSDVGAYCIGAGVARDAEAIEAVLEKLHGFADDEARGYAAVALGLMDAGEAIAPIKQIVTESKYRPELLKQAAIALGLLGDKQLVDDLVEMLANARGLATQAAISSALGFIGDQHAVDPLVGMLQDKSITASARGFAAVALGIVADKERLPWNAKISVDINYRANTTTLTGAGGTGVLDIL
jgi:HEAT repeat protein